MRTFLLSLALAAIFGVAVLPQAMADEFSGEPSITEHHWGGGHYRRGRRGHGRGGYYYDDGAYYGGGYCN